MSELTQYLETQFAGFAGAKIFMRRLGTEKLEVPGSPSADTVACYAEAVAFDSDLPRDSSSSAVVSELMSYYRGVSLVPAWMARLSVEHADVYAKLRRLYSFVGSDKYDLLSGDDAVLLTAQLKAMEDYLVVMAKRLERAVKKLGP